MCVCIVRTFKLEGLFFLFQRSGMFQCGATQTLYMHAQKKLPRTLETYDAKQKVPSMHARCSLEARGSAGDFTTARNAEGTVHPRHCSAGHDRPYNLSLSFGVPSRRRYDK